MQRSIFGYMKELPSVEEAPVFNEFGKRIRGYKVLRYPGKPSWVYSIVSEKYQPIEHKEVIEMTKGILEDAGFEIKKDGVELVGKYGSKMFYRAVIDEFEVLDGDKIGLGVLVTNSYDGEMGIYMGGYGLRLVCMNEMVFGRAIIAEYTIHVGEVEKRFRDRLLSLVEGMQDVQVFLRSLAKAQITKDQMVKLLIRLNLAKKYLKMIARHSGISRWDVERIPLWDLYNAITYVMTHKAYTMNYERRVEYLKKLNNITYEIITGKNIERAKRGFERQAQEIMAILGMRR